MMDNVIGLAYGIVTVAMVIGVGLLVLYNFGLANGAGLVNTTVTTIMGYLGTGSGGLASWIPAIIAVFIGFLFLAYFMGGKKGRK